MIEEQNINEPQSPAFLQGAVSGCYYWHCRFTFPDDKVECYLTEWNNCRTFKQLRKWWRKEKPNLKLVSAVRQ